MSIYKEEKLVTFKGAGLFPRHFFTAFAIGGGTILFLAKFFVITPYITVLIPIVSIIAYCMACTSFPLLLISEDKIGDNAYYLGFLYTLTSLSFALWDFASGLNVNAPEEIISSFGIALSSTMIGVIVRVYFLSLSLDPDDIEKDARMKISAAANALTIELQQASSAFNIYRRALQQSITEAFTSINEKVDNNLTNSANKITADLDKVSNTITESHAELNEGTTGLAESIKTSIQTINKINSKVDKSFLALTDSAGSLGAIINGQIQSLNDMSSAAANFLKLSQTIHQQITLTKDQVTNLGQTGQNINGITEKANTNLTSFSEALAKIAKAQEEVVSVIAQNSEELKNQLGKSIKYTDEAHSSISKMARTLADKLQ